MMEERSDAGEFQISVDSTLVEEVLLIASLFQKRLLCG